jgi:peptidoglycan/xylan/chitin deacetylase (PgdA/CDA1 family)
MRSSLWLRLPGAYRRRMAKWFGCQPFFMPALAQPIVTFTFDDFPRSALFSGGAILEEHGGAGTYYVALGLMKQIGPTGEIFHPEDLELLISRGHEAGCHTFDHCPAWGTRTPAYEASVHRNILALKNLIERSTLQTHSYPIETPRPSTKRRVGARFRACRGGGQSSNHGIVDLNSMNSFFLEQSVENFGAIERIITANSTAGGWLIFSTHDVCDNPTRFGCTPGFFEGVVRSTVKSGAKILTMSEALNSLGVPPLS